jgi:ribosomal protein S12 methylthiotransferase
VDELCDFIRETRFERLGVFRYSQEEGTKAAKLENQIPAKEKERRWHKVMALQKKIAAEIGNGQIGRRVRVLVEKPGIARGETDAPDIDGRIFVSSDLPVGRFTEVTIKGCRDYDLLAQT